MDSLKRFGRGGLTWYFYMRDDNYANYDQDWIIEHCKQFNW